MWVMTAFTWWQLNKWRNIILCITRSHIPNYLNIKFVMLFFSSLRLLSFRLQEHSHSYAFFSSLYIWCLSLFFGSNMTVINKQYRAENYSTPLIITWYHSFHSFFYFHFCTFLLKAPLYPCFVSHSSHLPAWLGQCLCTFQCQDSLRCNNTHFSMIFPSFRDTLAHTHGK